MSSSACEDPFHTTPLIVQKQKSPQVGVYKLNIDGNFILNSNNIGSRGVIRDHDKKWIFGFYVYDGKGDVMKAGIFRLIHRLQLAWDKGIRHICQELDNQDVVDILHKIGRAHV